MAPNLRLSLTIFTIGFVIEAGVDAYHLVTGSSKLFAGSALFLVGAVATVLGLIFLTIGRHEWNELHRTRVRHGHLTFLVVLLLGAAAAGPLAYYAYQPGLSIPSWLAYEVGAAIAASLFFTFILYAIIVYHLLGRTGQAILVLALVAAVPVVSVVGNGIAGDIPRYLALVRSSPASLSTVVEPIVSLLSWMFLAYALLALAFVDAHRRVARGLEPPSVDGASTTPPPAPPRPS